MTYMMSKACWYCGDGHLQPTSYTCGNRNCGQHNGGIHQRCHKKHYNYYMENWYCSEVCEREDGSEQWYPAEQIQENDYFAQLENKRQRQLQIYFDQERERQRQLQLKEEQERERQRQLQFKEDQEKERQKQLQWQIYLAQEKERQRQLQWQIYLAHERERQRQLQLKADAAARNNLHIAMVNVGSMSLKKMDTISQRLHGNNFDILVLTEIRSQSNWTVENSSYNYFTFCDKNPATNRLRGGVGIFGKTSLDLHKIASGRAAGFDYVLLFIKKQNIFVCGVYRDQKEKSNGENLFRKFSNVIENHARPYLNGKQLGGRIVLLGDFNKNYSDEKVRKSAGIQYFTERLRLKQIVEVSTHGMPAYIGNQNNIPRQQPALLPRIKRSSTRASPLPTCIDHIYIPKQTICVECNLHGIVENKATGHHMVAAKLKIVLPND